jgi:hypothetical protein
MAQVFMFAVALTPTLYAQRDEVLTTLAAAYPEYTLEVNDSGVLTAYVVAENTASRLHRTVTLELKVQALNRNNP